MSTPPPRPGVGATLTVVGTRPPCCVWAVSPAGRPQPLRRRQRVHLGYGLSSRRLIVPAHYDDYRVFRSPLSDFVAEVHRRGLSACLRTVARGDTVELFPVAGRG